MRDAENTAVHQIKEAPMTNSRQKTEEDDLHKNKRS